MSFVGNPLDLKRSQIAGHCIIPCISLVGENDGPRSRLVGKQLSMPDKTGAAADRGKPVLRQVLIVKFGGGCNMADQAAYLTALFSGIRPVDCVRNIIGRSPEISSVMDGRQAGADVTGKRADFAA